MKRHDHEWEKKDGYLGNPAIQETNPAIEERNPAIQSEKLSIEKLKKGFLNKNYRENTKDNILAVYNDIDTNQIFGAPEIERILDSWFHFRNFRDLLLAVKI